MPKTAADASRYAYSHLGDHEDPPGSNHCIYSSWYDADGKYGSDSDPWCLKFASFVVVGQCGVTLPGAQSPRGFASAQACLTAAKDHGRWVDNHSLRTGDIVVFHIPGEHAGGNHGGIFIRYEDNGDTVVSVDGNTAGGNTGGSSSDRDGGHVAERKRPTSWSLGGYRPGYAPPTPAPVGAHPTWWTKVTHVGQASQEVASALKVLGNRDFPPQVTLDSHVAGLFRYIQSKRAIAQTGNLDAPTAQAIATWAR